MWKEETLKTITGGDAIPVRFMRGDFFVMQPAVHSLGVHQRTAGTSHGGRRYQATPPHLALRPQACRRRHSAGCTAAGEGDDGQGPTVGISRVHMLTRNSTVNCKTAKRSKRLPGITSPTWTRSGHGWRRALPHRPHQSVTPQQRQHSGITWPGAKLKGRSLPRVRGGSTSMGRRIDKRHTRKGESLRHTARR